MRATVAANLWLSFPKSLRSQTVTQQRGEGTAWRHCHRVCSLQSHRSKDGTAQQSLTASIHGGRRNEGTFPCPQSSQRWVRSPLGVNWPSWITGFTGFLQGKTGASGMDSRVGLG